MEELENLQLEEARETAAKRQQDRLGRDSRAKAIEMSLRRDKSNQERIQSGCTHRKGGKGVGQIYAGNDSNFAVITYTLSHGPTIVVCQRCYKVWRKPEPLSKKATPEQRAQYKLEMADYRYAINLPTDNEPGGTVLFAFAPEDEDAA
jgi:hypothetical protein